METTNQWLLNGDPWVAYGTRTHLLGEIAEDAVVKAARAAMLEHPFIRGLVSELQDWPGAIINSHKSSGTLLHKLTFAADIGLRYEDPGMEGVIERILEHRDPLGPVQMLGNVSPHYGGSGEDTWGWALCDSPSILYALARMGMADDPRVRQGVDYLAGLVRSNGWPCAVSQEMGTFRGPGRKDDPCPYANLVMLKLLAQLPDYRDGEAAHYGAEALLSAWGRRREYHPYIFYMGTDFCKLKAPLVWYDILHVTHVLSQFSWLHADPRLGEMLEIMRSKANADGCYTAESIWTAWKDWEFGQKKQPSRWLTLLVLTVLQQLP